MFPPLLSPHCVPDPQAHAPCIAQALARLDWMGGALAALQPQQWVLGLAEEVSDSNFYVFGISVIRCFKGYWTIEEYKEGLHGQIGSDPQ